MLLAKPVKQQRRVQALRQSLRANVYSRLRILFYIRGQPFRKSPRAAQLRLIQSISRSALPHQEINVLAVDGDAAGKKTQPQLIVVNGLSCLLNDIDRQEVQPLCFDRLPLAVSNAGKPGFGLPAQRGFRTGSGKHSMKELIGIAETLFGNCNIASQE